jgi:hypothetical protein
VLQEERYLNKGFWIADLTIETKGLFDTYEELEEKK